MLSVQVKAHREFFLANTPDQRLFVALHLQPGEGAQIRPPLSVAFVVDTSGSMRERVSAPTGFSDLLFGKNKLTLLIEALNGLITSGLLREEDRISLTQFDDNVTVILPFTSAAEEGRILAAIQRLKQFNGATQMGQGMQKAFPLLRHEQGNRRMVVLTDGQTADEKLVLKVARELADAQIPATTVGVGSDVNTGLLTEVADLTQGRPMDVVPDSENPYPPAVRASELPQALLGDLRSAANEVVTGVTLGIKTIKDVVVERITRVQPTQTEVDMARQPMLLGNLDAQMGSTFVIELVVPARPPSRMRLGQLNIGFQIPGTQRSEQLPPIDLVVEYTAEDALATRIDPEVMRWVQQRNVEGLIVQATREMSTNPQKAGESLLVARQMTERLGNANMTRVLDQAIGELQSGNKVSVSTAKTLQIGAKTQTLGTQSGTLPTDEEIRKATGA